MVDHLRARWTPRLPAGNITGFPSDTDWSSAGAVSADINSDLHKLCGSYPFAGNCRDPNKAWNQLGRIAFLTIYILAWVVVVLVVKYWDRIKRKLPCLWRQKSQTNNNNVSRSQPLVELSEVNEEVNVGPTPQYPSDRCAHELFEDCVAHSPNAVALIIPYSEGQARREITYQALSGMIEEVATALTSLGIANQSIAALSLRRSVAQIVAVFGTLKAGAAYLPMDPELPISRKETFLSDSEAGALIAEQRNTEIESLAASKNVPLLLLANSGTLGKVERFGMKPSTAPKPRHRQSPSDMAMLIYTSGTTGTPKGIVYDHRHLMHGNYFFGDLCEVNENSVTLLKSPYFWAVIEYEMFPALTRGGSLVVASADGHKSPDYLTQVISHERVSVLMMTPSVLDLVLDIHEAHGTSHPLQSLKHVVTVGEPLPCALANRFVQTAGITAWLTNMYGASESSCTLYTVPKEGVNLSLFPNKAPAGVPQPHVRVYVMQSSQAEDLNALSKIAVVPTGEAGEIFFGGVLADGYFKRDELTREKFFEHEVYGLLYRTGDLGRWVQGDLEVIGRTDRQVKIHGVRIEPEEVESVLKRFKLVLPQEDVHLDVDAAAAGVMANEGQNALRQVSVVASPEPAELVAFVSLRDGIQKTSVKSDQLKAHCDAALTPAYVPKFFVILDDFPCLANGKPNLSELKNRAAEHVDDEGAVVMDSLGQMKKMSRNAILETQVIHRCYAYWMVGVLCDHWNRCALDSDQYVLFPFCTALATASVQPWTEMLVRTFGNDQDMFGFIMLGALQDSRPGPGGKKSIKFGLTDLFIFVVYMMMALPIAQIMHYIFQQIAWPIAWGDRDGRSNADAAPKNIWSWDYMQVNSDTSDHRWYLIMVLQARFLIFLGEKTRCPGWLQVLLVFWPCCLPSSMFVGSEYLWDGCSESSTLSIPAQFFLSWLFRNFGDGCAVFYRWVWWYVVFYIAAYHWLRPGIKIVTPYLPSGPVWAAMSVAASMIIGLLMGMYHYPNDTLETGTNMAWAPLEVGVDFIQPVLFALGMTWFPLNMAWWGNTTLGCYVFHFYFKDHMCVAIQKIGDALAFDPTGMLTLVAVVGSCCIYTTFLGPLGHYLLLSPTFAYARIRRALASRSSRAVRAGGSQPAVPGLQPSGKPTLQEQ